MPGELYQNSGTILTPSRTASTDGCHPTLLASACSTVSTSATIQTRPRHGRGLDQRTATSSKGNRPRLWSSPPRQLLPHWGRALATQEVCRSCGAFYCATSRCGQPSPSQEVFIVNPTPPKTRAKAHDLPPGTPSRQHSGRAKHNDPGKRRFRWRRPPEPQGSGHAQPRPIPHGLAPGKRGVHRTHKRRPRPCLASTWLNRICIKPGAG